MKLAELKQATRHLHLLDLDHQFQVGRIAYKMGINREACPIKLGLGHDAWQKGFEVAKREFEALLKRNGAGGSKLLWMV
jgi:hypothetical protein